MRRTIREKEPARPSTRLSTMLAADLTTLAKHRQAEPARLASTIRGDLDWIVMKAMEKDRTRRYETASGLAMDIQRHLHNEPIVARPQSAAYRFQKMIRRNRSAFAAAGAITFVLVLGVITSTWQAVRIAEADKRVAVAAANAEKQAKLSAEAREAETKAVLEFVENKVFAATWPGGLGRDVTVRAALEAALSSVDRSFPEQPLIEARLRLTLGTTFAQLGDYRISADQAERARRIYSKSLGADHPDTLKSMHNLAISYDALGRQADAFKLREETLALTKAKLGPDHPQTLLAMNELALSYASLGQKREALKLHEETLALKKAKFGPDHPATLGSMNNLALAYSANGRHAEAIQLSEEVLALQKAKFGPDEPATLGSMDSLASIYNAAGRRSEAVELYEQTLAHMRDKLGSDHPTTLATMHSLASGYAALGRQREAGSLYEEAFALRKARLGPNHPETLRSMNKLARLLATSTDPKVRNTSRALELAEKAVELAPKEGNYWNTLGVAHYHSGECEAAVAALRKSMELRKGGNSVDWFFLSMAECQLGHQEEARKQYERAVAWMNKNDPKNESLTRYRRQAADLLGVKDGQMTQ